MLDKQAGGVSKVVISAKSVICYKFLSLDRPAGLA